MSTASDVRREPRPDLPPHPIGGPGVVAARLVGGAVAIWGLLYLIGRFIVDTEKNGGMRWDADTEVWLASHRTTLFDNLSAIGSGMADTYTCIAITVVVAIALRAQLGRWYESWIVVTAITGELWIFLGVTYAIERARPGVELMDSAPPTSSFPSGHTGAAMALYGCLAVLVWRRFHGNVTAWLGVTVLWLVPVAVAASRLYRGMHFPTDVAVGALGGGLWLLIVVTTFPRPEPIYDPVVAELIVDVPAKVVAVDARTAAHTDTAVAPSTTTQGIDDAATHPIAERPL